MSFPHMQQQAQHDTMQLHQGPQQQHPQQFNSPQVSQRNLNNLFQQQQQHLLQTQQPQQLLAPQPQLQLPQHTIKEVWSDNFHHEFQIIRRLINKYNYISFSTEFPGILARPMGVFTSTSDYHYQTLRTNCDLLKLIQFGISLSDAKGEKPENIYSTWQFNFKFDLNSDMISTEAFESLMKTGIDFPKHQVLGINAFEFSELLISSGLILLDNYYWTSFHSGYDFGFLVAMLTNNIMPLKEEDFLNKLHKYFPNVYDLKVLAKHILNSRDKDTNKLSLEQLAEELGISRQLSYISTGGQALLTNICFTELKNRVGNDDQLTKFNSLIHGLSNEQQVFQQHGSYPINQLLAGHDL